MYNHIALRAALRLRGKLVLQPFDIGDYRNIIANGNESMIFKTYQNKRHTFDMGIITRTIQSDISMLQ